MLHILKKIYNFFVSIQWTKRVRLLFMETDVLVLCIQIIIEKIGTFFSLDKMFKCFVRVLVLGNTFSENPDDDKWHLQISNCVSVANRVSVLIAFVRYLL